MTDKQIIIDGIDVSGCIYYKATGRYNTCGYYCEQNPNCYYKQSKRKEQECERLNKWLPIVTRLEMAFGSIETEKAKAIDYDTYAGEIFRQLDQLKAELEQEKNWHKTADEIAKKNSEYANQLKAENDELKKQVDDLLHKPEIQDKILWKIDNEALLGSKDAYIYKLEKTLTEIKELVETCVELNDCTKYILQKISEANNEITTR